MCVRVHVRVWIRGYCKMPEKGVIAISVNLMELKGPTDVSKYRYCLQSTLLCLGSMLCIWGTRYNRIRLRNHPYRNVSVCLCACLCPCVFNMRHKFWVTCPGPLISSNHTGLTYQQVLFLHFCCLSSFHSDASISLVCAVQWIFSLQDAWTPFLLSRAVVDIFSFSALIEKLKVKTCFSLLLTDAVQSELTFILFMKAALAVLDTHDSLILAGLPQQ